MKKLILVLGVLVLMAKSAHAVDYGALLPYSNELSGVAASAVATPFAAVAVSSVTPTRIDTAVNTALSTSLGAGYKRAELQVQVYDSASVKCNYSSASVSTAATGGFFFTQNAAPAAFAIGKAIGIWCQGVVSTATFMVGGLGYK